VRHQIVLVPVKVITMFVPTRTIKDGIGQRRWRYWQREMDFAEKSVS
jgi:hypothetical protein